jgi:hypothetical protein
LKRIGKYLLSASALLIMLSAATAQEARFIASVDKNPVSVGDPFSVKFTLENGRGDISPPPFTEFDLIFGPSTSTSFQWDNGKQRSTMTVSYTLRAREEGKFTIGAATARIGGKTLQSESIALQVVQGRSQPATSAQQGNVRSQQPAQQDNTKTDANLLVRTQLSKKKVYQGEAVVVSFVLLSRYNNIDIGATDFPTLDGFWTEDIKSGASSWENELEYLNGVPYRKAILRQQLLFPQRSGTLELQPFKLTAQVNRSFFSAGTSITVQSYSQAVEVMPLPGGAPASFNGAVGEYAFDGKVGKTELRANDAIDLSMSLKGKGNLKLVKAPAIDFPGDFEVYDPEVKDRISITAGGMNGSRTWEYLVIPRYPGTYALPKFSFSYFSPVQGRYITETVGPFNIKVSGEDGAVPEGQAAAIARSRVEPVASEIRYIATNPDGLNPKGQMFFGTFGFYLLVVSPLLLFVGFVVFHKKREAILGDVKTLRSKKAHRLARKRLEAAKAAMDKGESKIFYGEIFNAMYGFLADKLGTEKAALTKMVIKNLLNPHGEHIANEATYIIETCELARFAPVSGQSDQMFYTRVSEFIEKLEGTFK